MNSISLMKALQRQIEEAVRIDEAEEGELMNSKKGYGTNKIPRIKILMGEDVRGRRDERDAERERREEKEQRERENKKREENIVWEEGGECIWEVYDESERWSEWRGEKMGAARTRGRMEENKREGWWGVKRWRRMFGGENGGGSDTEHQRGEKRGLSQSTSTKEEDEDDHKFRKSSVKRGREEDEEGGEDSEGSGGDEPPWEGGWLNVELNELEERGMGDVFTETGSQNCFGGEGEKPTGGKGRENGMKGGGKSGKWRGSN